MKFKQWLWQKLPPKIGSFFQDGPETIIESRLSPEQLLCCLRDSLNKVVSWNTGASRGSVIGFTLRIRWGSAFVSDSFEPLFRGRIEDAEGGSRIIGCMSHNRFVQAFMAAWCGCIILFSIVMVWTIIIPLGGWGLLWMANGIISLGDRFSSDRRERILEDLSHCAGGTL
ncbi:hypothetical protein [Prosthecobacter sp.]|uniref:hypothetical protein n=1 Tax=Prosthecobacter sp. TaxID=1965333 RepID=UPI00378349A5